LWPKPWSITRKVFGQITTNLFVIPVGNLLLHFEFASVQGSVLLSESEDLANLLLAMNALKALPWFPKVVRDIRAFRVEQWSDFTGFMKA
jgi:virulence-associated protein VapD